MGGRTNNYHSNTDWRNREEPNWVKRKRWEREMASVQAHEAKSADEKVAEWNDQINSHMTIPMTSDEFFEKMEREYEEKKKAKLNKAVDVESLAWK